MFKKMFLNTMKSFINQFITQPRIISNYDSFILCEFVNDKTTNTQMG